MFVGEKLSYSAANEAYCLLTAYLREDGKLHTKYDKEPLKEFCFFLSEVLKNPENFVDVDRSPRERLQDGSLKPLDSKYDGTGLA